MKISLVKFTLTALATVILAACGSGGGGSSSPANDSSAKPVQPSQPAQPSQPSKSEQSNQPTKQEQGSKPAQPVQPANPAQPSESIKPNQPSVDVIPQKGTGGMLVVEGEDENASYKKETLDSTDLTKITVDGKELTLVDGKSNNMDFTVFGKDYSDVRFGAIKSFEAGQGDVIFYNGNPTKDMPTQGSADYHGESVLTSHGEEIPDDYMTGTSNFKADFANKKLTGDLKINNKAANVDVTIKVDANISGNAFAGTASSSSFAKQGISEGKFYGDNAKELGGLVKAEDNSWGGAFGAKKQ